MVVLIRTALPVAVLTSAIVLAAALYGFGYGEHYISFTSFLGASPFRFPFLDTHGLLSPIECYRMGVDVYALNPCDALGRIHTYSPLWLHLSALPVNVSWTPFVGLTLLALFLTSLPLLPPARGAWQLVAIVAGTASATVAYAIERGNVDLLMFFFAMVTIRLAQRNNRLRLLGYAVALVAAALKFYPVALLLIVARERIARAIVVGLIGVASVGGFLAFEWQDVARAVGALPTTCHNTQVFELNDFGARNLPCGIARLTGWKEGAALPMLLLFYVAMVSVATSLAWRGALAARIAGLTELEKTCLLGGSALLLFCFFCAQNVLYRGIFFLLVLPGLTTMIRPPGGGRASRPLIVAVLLVLLLLDWHTAQRLLDRFFRTQGTPLDGTTVLANLVIWSTHELLWWVVITSLVALLLTLLMQTASFQDLRAVAWPLWTRIRNLSAQSQAAPGLPAERPGHEKPASAAATAAANHRLIGGGERARGASA